MKVQQAYTDWAETYDSDPNLTRDLDQQVTRNTLGKLRFDSVVEIGCGTGKNTALLAEISSTVVALDFSEAMISRAREKSRFEHVTFKITDINQRWPCGDQSADLICCNLVLEHVADLSLIFGEAARVLVSHGQFFISELHPFRQYQGVQARFSRNEETTRIPAFVHHVTDFLDAAGANKLSLVRLNEWWHEEDQGKPPRLISFMFRA